ncbi:MAG: flavin reductase family protein [Acidimicrobiia bacterium]
MTADNPFLPPPEHRDQDRRFRGRLAGPVTIVTAGNGRNRTGLTVSSLFVVEGDPGRIHMVVGPQTDLWDALEVSQRCVIHIARESHQAAADVFAGLRPSPGGPFATMATTDSAWGPVLIDLTDRAYCRLLTMEEEGWSGRVALAIDKTEVTDLPDPLIHFRGAYRKLR